MIAIEKMIVADRTTCVGCYACYSVCPVSAITMQEDVEGFRYPLIDVEKCIKCGACEKVCPGLHPIHLSKDDKPVTYAAISNDDIAREKSSSGGVFQLLAVHVLQKDGIVFGAAFDEIWEVHHTFVESIADLEKLQTSKYLQSRIEDSYKKVKIELQKNREVLFVGTPCQTVGLKNFLKKEYDNLTIVDFICHGVPSPAVWRQYLQARVGNLNLIREISFRDKNLSWERYLLTFSLKKDNKYLSADLNTDLYLKGFLQNLYLRPSCHYCKFCRQNRPVDITLADFWGVKNVVPEMYDMKGTSLLFIHSEKGRKLVQQLNIRKKQVPFSRSVQYNTSMLYPAQPSLHRTEFFRDFKKHPLELYSLIEKYTRLPLKVRIKNVIKSIPGICWVIRKVKK